MMQKECKECVHFRNNKCCSEVFCYDNGRFLDKNSIVDLDGNKLSLGDKIFFATRNKEIMRGKIYDIDSWGALKIYTTTNRHSRAYPHNVLLDTTGK